jgi:hypothetical protein
VALVAALVFLACWPWLWPDPLGRLSGAVRHFGTLVFDRKVLYLGEIHRTVSLPWHYTLVSLLIATPTVFLAAAALSALTPDPEQRPAFQRIRRLACLWIVALFALDAAATTHYDGFRHLLVVLPGLCMLIGLGLENLAHLSARWLGTEPVKESRAACELRRTRRGGVAAPPSIPPPIRVGAAPCHDASRGLSAGGGFFHRLSAKAGLVAPAAALALAALSCWRLHPYQDAYLNEIVNLFVAGRAEEVFEVEYWGSPYKEGAEWLNAHAEANAEIYLPEMSQAGFYLDREGKVLDEVEEFADPSAPRYFMTITRRAFYRPPVTRVARTYEPVFEIRRQESVLLRIYKNDRKRSPRAPRRARSRARALAAPPGRRLRPIPGRTREPSGRPAGSATC